MKHSRVIAALAATAVATTLFGAIDHAVPTTSSGAVAIDYANLVDDRSVKVQSAFDVAAKRRELVQFVWGSAGFPETNGRLANAATERRLAIRTS